MHKSITHETTRETTTFRSTHLAQCHQDSDNDSSTCLSERTQSKTQIPAQQHGSRSTGSIKKGCLSSLAAQFTKSLATNSSLLWYTRPYAFQKRRLSLPSLSLNSKTFKIFCTSSMSSISRTAARTQAATVSLVEESSEKPSFDMRLVSLTDTDVVLLLRARGTQ